MARRMFPHTVTVYNVTVETDEYYYSTTVNYITVLRGVFVNECKAANVLRSGLVDADGYEINIPADVEAVDGVTGSAKEYCKPGEWDAKPQGEHEKFWTISLDGKGKSDTFVMFGEIVEPGLDLDGLLLKYGKDSMCNPTTVSDKRYKGSRIPHWEIGAK